MCPPALCGQPAGRGTNHGRQLEPAQHSGVGLPNGLSRNLLVCDASLLRSLPLLEDARREKTDPPHLTFLALRALQEILCGELPVAIAIVLLRWCHRGRNA